VPQEQVTWLPCNSDGYRLSSLYPLGYVGGEFGHPKRSILNCFSALRKVVGVFAKASDKTRHKRPTLSGREPDPVVAAGHAGIAARVV
jgi:hypothetical protein